VIWERSLKEFAWDVYHPNNQIVWYKDLGQDQGGILLYVIVLEQSKIIDKDNFLSVVVLVKAIYTRVEEFRKFLVCDPSHNVFEYTNDPSTVKQFGESTKVFMVKDTPDEIIDKIAEKIVKNQK
jgi:hypothetical protein